MRSNVRVAANMFYLEVINGNPFPLILSENGSSWFGIGLLILWSMDVHGQILMGLFEGEIHYISITFSNANLNPITRVFTIRFCGTFSGYFIPLWASLNFGIPK
jgi:hypothetical protein